MSEVFDLQTLFDVWEFDIMEIIIKKIKKVITFEVRYLKYHILVFYNIIAFFFLIEVSQYFGEK